MSSSQMQKESNYVSMENFLKVEKRLKRKEEEIKTYKEILNNYKDNIDTLESNLKSTQEIFSKINEKLNEPCKSCLELKELNSHLQYQLNKEIQDFTTKDSSAIAKVNKDGYLRKIEEIEACYHELTKQFTLLSQKYTICKEEISSLTNENSISKEQLAKSNSNLMKKTEENIKLTNEAFNLKCIIERVKEIDICLLENTMKTYLLNCKKGNESNPLGQRQSIDNNDGSVSYILCEPMPSIVKFIANTKRNTSMKRETVKGSEHGTNNSIAIS